MWSRGTPHRRTLARRIRHYQVPHPSPWLGTRLDRRDGHWGPETAQGRLGAAGQATSLATTCTRNSRDTGITAIALQLQLGLRVGPARSPSTTGSHVARLHVQQTAAAAGPPRLGSGGCSRAFQRAHSECILLRLRGCQVFGTNLPLCWECSGPVATPIHPSHDWLHAKKRLMSLSLMTLESRTLHEYRPLERRLGLQLTTRRTAV